MLKTKCIWKPKEKTDDMRILIIPHNVASDLKISQNTYDYHMTQYAPPLKLLRDYSSGRLPWGQFEKGYLEYLGLSEMGLHMEALIAMATDKFTATVMCAEENPEYCYRRILAEECKRLAPNLVVKIE